jgi:hypothetical protein
MAIVPFHSSGGGSRQSSALSAANSRGQSTPFGVVAPSGSLASAHAGHTLGLAVWRRLVVRVGWHCLFRWGDTEFVDELRR